MLALLRAVVKERYPSKGEDAINQIIDSIIGSNGQGSIEMWSWKKIIEKMYDEDDYQ